MHTVIFVHGTGVREASYDASFAQIQEQLTTLLGATHVRVEPCFWGGALGSDLFLGGVSIPEFDTTRGIDGLDADEYAIALWALLYGDPVAELDLLGLRERGELAPSQEPPGTDIDDRARRLSARGDGIPEHAVAEFVATLGLAGLAEYFDQARAEVTRDPAYRRALALAVEPLTDYRLAIARAIIAQAVALYREATDADGAPFDATTRDRLVELIVGGLGGRDAGVIDWVKENAGRLVKRAGTRWFRNRRGRLSATFAPFGADIIAYQARPRRVQVEIRKEILRVSAAARARGESGELIALAHSLGGIAAVDMLITEPLPEVRHLVTVGSQAPLLYELDALTSLDIQRDVQGAVRPAPHPLPSGFPDSWLNIFDPRDFLSYRAAPVFGDRVRDKRVDNGQPFPDSHSAYWTNADVWTAFTNHVSGHPV